MSSSGHTVLAIPVPALEVPVVERTRFYDDSFVSTDPDFSHAHITVLAPWVQSPTDADLEAVAAVAASIEPFEITLARLAAFPDGVIHLVPEPGDPLRLLTARMVEAFPGYPPYGGAFGEVDPHLTLDRLGPQVSIDQVHDRIRDWLPATMSVQRLDLQWWANHDCRRLASWPLGASRPDEPDEPDESDETVQRRQR